MAAPLAGIAVKAGKALAATVPPEKTVASIIVIAILPFLLLALVFVLPITMLLTIPAVDASDISLYKKVVTQINTEKNVQLKFQELVAIDAALTDQDFKKVSEETIKNLADKFLWSEKKKETYWENETKYNPVTKKNETVKVQKTKTVTVWHTYTLDQVLEKLLREGKISDKQEVLSYMSVDIAYFEMQNQKVDLPDNWIPGGTGDYEWPTPGYNKVGSPFGMRIHPIKKVPKFHSGIDIDAPMGAPIVSSKDGKVTKATYSGDAGNCVVIENKDKTVCRYLHLNAYNCKYGDTVKKGDVIGYVGTTGLSTGPHLHYEIRINGNPVNPLDSFK